MQQEREALENQCVHSVKFVKKYDEITGGRWVDNIPVVFGRMRKLALTNHDHFQPHAKFAYLAGHELALACAKQAGLSDDEEERKNGLEEAYAIDWFTCHFLTDSFASGHMRYKHALQFGLLLKLKLLILKASLDREDNSFISFPKEWRY